MHHRDDADEAPEPITMTPAEFRQAARAGLRRLGLTYQQLAEQAHARDFTSRRHTNCGSPSEEQQDSTRRRWPRMVIEYESRKKKIGKKALRALKEFGEYSVGGAHLCRDLFPVPSLGREREGTGLNARCGNRWEQVREQCTVLIRTGTGFSGHYDQPPELRAAFTPLAISLSAVVLVGSTMPCSSAQLFSLSRPRLPVNDASGDPRCVNCGHSSATRRSTCRCRTALCPCYRMQKKARRG